eukprot:GAHX01002534.1.p1 GENE.GAHX01002534.1~~GAHX01002534.1.p1  ORF type:complete len:650 (+),score=127.68 GAHX01002534.1:68-2017(+)
MDLTDSRKILEEIMNNKDASYFKIKLTKEYLGDLASEYFYKIPNPLDLTTISENIYASKYNSDKEAIDDMRLVMKNAIRYNPANTLLYSQANKLLDELEILSARYKIDQKHALYLKEEAITLKRTLSARFIDAKLLDKTKGFLDMVMRNVRILSTKHVTLEGRLQIPIKKLQTVIFNRNFEKLSAIQLYETVEELEGALGKNTLLVTFKDSVALFKKGIYNYYFRQKKSEINKMVNFKNFIENISANRLGLFENEIQKLSLYNEDVKTSEFSFFSHCYYIFVCNKVTKTRHNLKDDNMAYFNKTSNIAAESLIDARSFLKPLLQKKIDLHEFSVLLFHNFENILITDELFKKAIANVKNFSESLFGDFMGKYCDVKIKGYHLESKTNLKAELEDHISKKIEKSLTEQSEMKMVEGLFVFEGKDINVFDYILLIIRRIDSKLADTKVSLFMRCILKFVRYEMLNKYDEVVVSPILHQLNIFESSVNQDNIYFQSIIEDLKSKDFISAFEKPLNPVEFGMLNYFDVITTPVDIETLQSRIKKLGYFNYSFEGRENNSPRFWGELEIMFINCIRYHRIKNPECNLIKNAKQLLEYVYKTRKDYDYNKNNELLNNKENITSNQKENSKMGNIENKESADEQIYITENTDYLYN